MNTLSSAAALVTAVLAAVAILFVWAGTEQVHFDWVAMDDDFGQVELASIRNPMSDMSAPVSSGSDGPVMGGINRLLWINISGFRADYVESAESPFFDEIDDYANSTDSLLPAFPSLTYPSLLSQATGRTVAGHGIPADKIRDPASGEIIAHPSKLSLLKAEPIWTTAKRQGLNVLVHDWPFSQEQPADHPADLFLSTYDEEKSDEDRLNALLDAWSSFQGPEKIHLAMANLNGLEKAARAYGSREVETYEAVTKLDQTLKTFFDKIRSKWPELRKEEGESLYVFLTTDHGMTDSAKVINFKDLMGELADRVTYTVDDAVAHLWFNEPPAGTSMELLAETYDEELKARIYWRSYPRGDYPASFPFGDGGDFMGDRFLVLKGGYSFTEESGSDSVFDPSETGGPFAVSGYSVTDSARMKGQGFFYRLDGRGYGSRLGDVQASQLHATACDVLGIQPADGASADALDVK